MKAVKGGPGKAAKIAKNVRAKTQQESKTEENGLPFDYEAMKKGISQVESSGGINMKSPYSSATGLYGQLYGELGDSEYMKGKTRDEFAEDIDLQNEIFDIRFNEGFEGIPSLKRNAYEVTEEYKDQLGDKWEFSLDEVAALSNFLGRDGARKYFASLRDGTKYVMPDNNKTPEEYLEIYRAARDKSISDKNKSKRTFSFQSNT
jgi:hypothetical protein